jgi:hypothetical protein
MHVTETGLLAHPSLGQRRRTSTEATAHLDRDVRRCRAGSIEGGDPAVWFAVAARL